MCFLLKTKERFSFILATQGKVLQTDEPKEVGNFLRKVTKTCQPRTALVRHRSMKLMESKVNMTKTPIQMPEKGTYKWQLFSYWSDEYRQTRADHSAYIALNFAGALDVCRTKLQKLIQHHRQFASDATSGPSHNRAIARLENTLSGAAMAYESSFKLH